MFLFPVIPKTNLYDTVLQKFLLQAVPNRILYFDTRITFILLYSNNQGEYITKD